MAFQLQQLRLILRTSAICPGLKSLFQVRTHVSGHFGELRIIHSRPQG